MRESRIADAAIDNPNRSQQIVPVGEGSDLCYIYMEFDQFESIFICWYNIIIPGNIGDILGGLYT